MIDYPKGVASSNKSWEKYVAVNQNFANAIAAKYKTGDISNLKTLNFTLNEISLKSGSTIII